MERQLISDYANTVEELLGKLDAGNVGLATEIASVPEHIRGFGHVKARNLAAVRPRWEALMAAWRDTAGAPARVA